MSAPQAIFGGPLQGDSLVRVIYIDEAGTSAHEPVVVVVGIIVHGDTQWIPAAVEIRAAIDKWVPASLRDTYVFHAKDLVSKKYREVWDFKDRLGLLHDMMSIPRRQNLPIALGGCVKSLVPKQVPAAVSLDEYSHMISFGYCLASVGKFLRERGGIREIGMAVAEDIPEMRNKLRSLLHLLRTREYKLAPQNVIATEGMGGSGELKASAREVIDTLHYASKFEAPFLQLADACAFGLRRYLSNLQYGIDYGKLILGESFQLETYRDAIVSSGSVSAIFCDSQPSGKIRISYSLSSPGPSAPGRSS